jgi:hypothetical protein
VLIDIYFGVMFFVPACFIIALLCISTVKFFLYVLILIYSSDLVPTGNTFQDLPRLRETADNTERNT